MLFPIRFIGHFSRFVSGSGMKRSLKATFSGCFIGFMIAVFGCGSSTENPVTAIQPNNSPDVHIEKAPSKNADIPHNDPKTSKSLMRFMGDNPAFLDLLDLPAEKRDKLTELIEHLRSEYNRISLETARKISLLKMEKPAFFNSLAEEEFSTILLKTRFKVDELLTEEQLGKADACFYQIFNGLQMDKPNVDILAALKLDEKQHKNIAEHIEEFNKYHDRIMERQVAATPAPQRLENQKALLLKRNELNEFIQKSLSRDQIRRASMLKEGAPMTLSKFQKAIDTYKKNEKNGT